MFPKLTYSWPFALVILASIGLYFEAGYQYIEIDLGAERLVQEIFGPVEGNLPYYPIIMGQGVGILFQLALSSLLLLGLRQMRLRRFEGDQYKALRACSILWIIVACWNIYLLDNSGSYFIFCSIMSLLYCFFYWKRLRNKPERFKTAATVLKALVVFAFSLLFGDCPKTPF